MAAPLCHALAVAVEGLSAQSNPQSNSHSNSQSNSQSNSGIERALVVAMSTLPLALALMPAPTIDQDKSDGGENEDNNDGNGNDVRGGVADNGGTGSGGSAGGDSASASGSGGNCVDSSEDDGGRLLSSLINLLRAYWTACAKHGAPSVNNTPPGNASQGLFVAQSNAQSNAALSAISREQQLLRRRQLGVAPTQWEIRALQTCVLALAAAATTNAQSNAQSNSQSNAQSNSQSNSQSNAQSNSQSNDQSNAQSNDVLLRRAYDASVAIHAYLLILGSRGRDRYRAYTALYRYGNTFS